MTADDPQAEPSGKRARTAAAADEPVAGPSPNPATNLAIADIALRGAAVVARRAIEHNLLGGRYSPRKAQKIVRGRTMKETLVHGVLARVALRSVPGAILVGGALVAKTLYDRGKARKARSDGDAALEQMARDGEE